MEVVMASVQVAPKVIDADAHVIESDHTWDYLLPHEERYRPQLFSKPGSPANAYWVLDGKIIGHRNPEQTEEELREVSRRTGRDVVSTIASRELSDVSARLSHMDELGIETQVLHSTLWIQPITENPAIDVALCGSWNRWMADIWKQSKGRLRYCAVMPTLDLEAAIEQVQFAKQNGAGAIAVRPLETSRFLADAYFYPLYEEAEKQDIAVAVHIANGSSMMLNTLRSPFDRSGGFALFRMPTVLECEVLMMSEVPERYPNLRFGFVEASANWVPWIVREVRTRFLARNRGPVPDNVLKHFNVYVTCETSDDIPFIIKHGGDENILIGTDYGHADVSSAMNAISSFSAMQDISDDSKRRILYENPKRLYGL